MNALPFAALLTTAVLAVACSTVAAPVASPMASTVAVAHVLGSRQCEGGGTKPQALAERLREAGVPVSALTCGHDGRMRPSDFRDRVVDVMEELFRMTLLLRDRSAVLTTRYSEQKQLQKAGALKAGLGVDDTAKKA